MIENLRLSIALMVFSTWCEGNLRTRQRAASFRRDLLIMAEYMLRKQGFARNYGLFPCARMELAQWVGLPEHTIKRCIPVLIAAGVLDRRSELIRRDSPGAVAFPESKNPRCHSKWFCPHQYLLGPSYARILRPEDGTELAASPRAEQCGQDKLTIVRDSNSESDAMTRKTGRIALRQGSVRIQNPCPVELRATADLDARPETAIDRLQRLVSAFEVMPAPRTQAEQQAAHDLAQEIEQAKANVELEEILRVRFKAAPLSAEAMGPSRGGIYR